MVKKEYRKKDSDSDEELIQNFQQGDLAAFDVIVRKYKDQLLNFAFRFLGNQEEAEDVVQETFLRLYRNKHAYRKIAKFSTWLYTIAGNLAKTELRKRKRRRLVSISDLGYEEKEYEIEDTSTDTERAVDSVLKEEFIQHAISGLSNRFREVIILRDIQGLSYEEVGEILKIPLGTVKSRVNRARLKLQDKLKDIKQNKTD
ncbi:sigma-70 family RNA polymerase sigma factor [candidate division KSB1 bacterium]|nr:sigma-70 family RNA polymerase sigma factor [candidate division KSB1 bacterium]